MTIEHKCPKCERVLEVLYKERPVSFTECECGYSIEDWRREQWKELEDSGVVVFTCMECGEEKPLKERDTDIVFPWMSMICQECKDKL